MNRVSLFYSGIPLQAIRRFRAIFAAVLLVAFAQSDSYAQSCSVSSITINTGYDPNTGSAITGGGNGCTPVTDPFWTITSLSSAMSTGIAAILPTYSGLMACGSPVITAVTPGNAADIITSVWGTPANTQYISCVNAHFIETAGTGLSYSFTASRTFTLCVADYVTFNLDISCDNYASSLLVDGAPASYTPQPATAGMGFNNYTHSMYLCAGAHTIEIVANNYDIFGSQMSNGLGLAVTGTISSAAGANTIRGETSSCIANGCGAPVAGGSTVCAGSTLALSSGAGGTWSSTVPAVGTVDASGVVTGLMAGTTTIIFTDHCGATYNHVVTVTPMGSLPAITGTAIMCEGAVTTLNNSVPGGTWTSDNTSIVTAATGAGPGDGDLTGVAAGTANITYATSCGSAYIVATVLAAPSISGPTVVCVGSTITISGSPSAGGTWTGGGAFATIVNTTPGDGDVTGVSAGTEVFTYTSASGCSSTVIITVDDVPMLPIMGPVLCVGSSIALGSTTSCTWSSNNTLVATVGLTSGLITGVSAGTAIITCTNACGSGTTTVSINPLPAITGSRSLCMPASPTTTLTATPSIGAWSGGSPAVNMVVFGANQLRVTAMAVGTAQITFTSGTTGCFNTAIVTVNSTPSIIGPNRVCQYMTMGLSNGGAIGGTWSSSNTSRATVNAMGMVTGVTPGTVRITYTNGCGSTNKIVTVDAAPTITTVSQTGYCASTGVTIDLSTSSTSETYDLYDGGTYITTLSGTGGPISFGPYFTGGTYTIVARLTSTGCTAQMSGSAFIDGSCKPGRNNAEGVVAGFKAYPNPTSGHLVLEAPAKGTFKVYSVDGRVCMEQEVNEGSTTLTLPKEITSGIYMCRFKGNDGTTSMLRIVVER